MGRHSRAEVGWSPDLERIKALPRRKATLAAGEEASDLLTPLLTTSRGKAVGARLRPWQALGLLELAEHGRLFTGLSMGGGKSLMIWLAMYIMADGVQPVIILPGHLVDDTQTKFANYSKHWVSPPVAPLLVSFEEYASDDNFDLLSDDRNCPTLICIDEVHKLKNHKRAIVKRIDRFQRDHAVTILPFTASVVNDALQDVSHLLTWSHQDWAPVPLNHNELEMWGNALNLKEPRIGNRPGVGALLELEEEPKSGPRLRRARQAWAHRAAETPGVLFVDDTECDVPLDVRFLVAPDDPELDQHFDLWRRKFKLPDGQIAGDIFNQLRWEDELGCGFFQKWKYPPPDDWFLANADKNELVRKTVRRTEKAKRPLDTEAAVLRALKDDPIVIEWLRVKPNFTPESVPEWLSGSVVHYVADWIERTGGLAVTYNPIFGEAVAEVAGCHFFGSLGEAEDGTFIEHERKGTGAICSFKANVEGRNLQYHWHDMLLVGCSSSGNDLEQMVSRIHRYGQNYACTFWILCTTGNTAAKWGRALERAEFAQELSIHHNKLLDFPSPHVIYPSRSSRWLTLGEGQELDDEDEETAA